MKNKKMPGRGGARAGRTKERVIKLSIGKYITIPSRGQWRRAVIWMIEAGIGFALVAGTILIAALLLKACGVM